MDQFGVVGSGQIAGVFGWGPAYGVYGQGILAFMPKALRKASGASRTRVLASTVKTER